MDLSDHFKRVSFKNYKALKRFEISLGELNVLVGPNNAGKSTVIGAFRLLSEGLRQARARKPKYLSAVKVWGYSVPLSNIPISTENIFSDYDDSEPATIKFELSSGHALELIFPEIDVCYLVPLSKGRPIRSTSDFNRTFQVRVGFVPVLGPVEHNEPLYQKEAARNALQTHRASRNFRNIWYHYPEGFEQFSQLVAESWPGMEIQRPEIDRSGEKPVVHMFCPEKRFPREIFWAGFGFQVWCQMLTYMMRASEDTMLIIDEPDIYLHSDLQRQLVSILRESAPDVLIATHSTEIVSEAETDEILVMRKGSKRAGRVRDVDQLKGIFESLGSNLNPVLTQLAKTRRAVFVEGKDFRILSAFARKLGYKQLAARSDFAVIPAHGFNPNMVRNFKAGIETTVGKSVRAAIVFDRDYRADDEVAQLLVAFSEFSTFRHIHDRKEIENFLLDPQVIQKVIDRKLAERVERGLAVGSGVLDASAEIFKTLEGVKSRVQGHYLPRTIDYMRSRAPGLDRSTLTQRALEDFERRWNEPLGKVSLAPGKDVLATFNSKLQEKHGFSVSAAAIIAHMTPADVPVEISQLLAGLESFRSGT